MNVNAEEILRKFLDERSSSRTDRVGDSLPLISAFGVGLLVGAGVALLFAPESGKELRDDLADRVEGLKEQASQAITAVEDRAKSPS